MNKQYTDAELAAMTNEERRTVFWELLSQLDPLSRKACVIALESAASGKSWRIASEKAAALAARN